MESGGHFSKKDCSHFVPRMKRLSHFNFRTLIMRPHPFLFCFLFMVVGLPLFARWGFIPLETLVKENPLIVSGTIVEVKVNPGPEDPEGAQLMDTGWIKVEAVLKNSLKGKDVNTGDRLPLLFPSQNRKIIISTDVVYRKGQSGIWILEYRDKAFYATYPGDLQSADKEKKIKDILAKGGKAFVPGRKRLPPQWGTGFDRSRVGGAVYGPAR